MTLTAAILSSQIETLLSFPCSTPTAVHETAARVESLKAQLAQLEAASTTTSTSVVFEHCETWDDRTDEGENMDADTWYSVTS